MRLLCQGNRYVSITRLLAAAAPVAPVATCLVCAMGWAAQARSDQPNVVLDSAVGHNIYRDGEKIATTGFIDDTDTIKSPGSTSYRYRVGAVDVAGNEAKSRKITVPTAQ